MADYMYLMARLPYFGVFPEKPVEGIEAILEMPEFAKAVNTPKKREFEKYKESIEEEIYNLRSGQAFVSGIFPAHLVKGNPLTREIGIMKLKWAILENIESFEADDEWLWIYKEKLEIIKRVSIFNKEKGMSFFKNAIEEVKAGAFEQNGTKKAEG